MKKKSLTSAVVAPVILLAVLNLIAFLAPFRREDSFWIGYSFSTFAILLHFGVTIFYLGRGKMTSRFYGLPMEIIVTIYMIIQFVLGLVFMIFPAIATWFSTIISVVPLTACLLGLIATDAAKRVIENEDEVTASKVFYIRSLQADIEGMIGRTQDGSLKKALRDLAEDVRYSDPMSADALATLENKISSKAGDLDTMIASGRTEEAVSLIAELRQLVTERNAKCRMLKH